MNLSSKKIAVLSGDGIGPEVIREAVAVLEKLSEISDFKFTLEEALVGGAAYDACSKPLPDATLELAKKSDAILFGAVGGPKWDALTPDKRPEAALLALRSELDLFANLRPAKVWPELIKASPLKSEIVENVDMLIVRELAGGMYFGKPRGVTIQDGQRVGLNSLVYTEKEIERIAHVGFKSARLRNKKLCSVDKANVLECTRLWRDVVIEVAKNYPDVTLTHLYVDNAAMQLVCNPRQFDVIVTENMFGDILSDEAAMITGSIGMLPSASLNADGKGMYEPIHGSAPDIAGKDLANPIATILSVAMMLTHSFNRQELADKITGAVRKTLQDGYRTTDIYSDGFKKVGTREMGRLVRERLS